ncbi:MAG: hypothetical protein K0S53_1921 [Bacteroidetes bacterium]|jgi:inosine/xanthosine triphosphate pyrophosphatase family protein/dephospho-CoA kinase|nr:hypothetical protein [Bacteroidota bacterium]
MLELIFITSNNEKLAHARYLSKEYAIIISKKKNYGIGYDEPRIDNREQLIAQSIEDAIKRFGKTVSKPENKFFFIEDTSVIIDALSAESEYPGVNIKYWMQENDFASIDKMLKDKGNDRRVQVRSDLILVLPKKLQEKFNKQYIVFTSSSNGNITSQEFNIETQPLFPWLNSKTFNKWFIPDTCDKPLSMLPIAEATKHDFRARAFREMLEFLKDNAGVKSIDDYRKDGPQLKLFEPYFYVVCGPTCSGKSTLADYLSKKYNYYHIEASDYMHLSYYEAHGINSQVTIADFAEAALKADPGIVANQILKDVNNLKAVPVIVTGFRSPDEIKNLEEKYIGGLYIEVVYIDAEQSIRFLRNQERGRYDVQPTIDTFSAKDQQQFGMGLSTIKEEASYIISNNNKLEDYYTEFETTYSKQFSSILASTEVRIPRVFKGRQLQNAIILTLAKQEDITKFYTTTEIAHLIKTNPDFSSNPKHKDNISRYFNQNFHPYFEISPRHGLGTYRLSQTGRAYAQWLLKNQ